MSETVGKLPLCCAERRVGEAIGAMARRIFTSLEVGMMARERNVMEMASLVNVKVCTWSPGDGVTRYRFFLRPVPGQTYYGPKEGDFTALGANEAMAYLRGITASKVH